MALVAETQMKQGNQRVRVRVNGRDEKCFEHEVWRMHAKCYLITVRKKKIKNALPWWTHGKWSCLTLVESRVRSVPRTLFRCNSLAVGIFYILCCCVYLCSDSLELPSFILGFWLLLSHRCTYYIAVCAFIASRTLTHSPHASPIPLSKFYVWFICLCSTTVFPNLIVFFLFASICSKHDFKLPEIAYFFRCSFIERYLLLSLMSLLFPFFLLLSQSISFCSKLVLV